jgi:hypothetical protein
LEDFSLPAVADLEKEMNMNEFNDARITLLDIPYEDVLLGKQGYPRVLGELWPMSSHVLVPGMRDDAPGYFGDKPPKTMPPVASEIISVYGAEIIFVIGDLTIEEGVAGGYIGHVRPTKLELTGSRSIFSSATWVGSLVPKDQDSQLSRKSMTRFSSPWKISTVLSTEI